MAKSPLFGTLTVDMSAFESAIAGMRDKLNEFTAAAPAQLAAALQAEAEREMHDAAQRVPVSSADLARMWTLDFPSDVPVHVAMHGGGGGGGSGRVRKPRARTPTHVATPPGGRAISLSEDV